MGWCPVAAGRGLPADQLHSPTWISWAELSRLDLDAKPPGVKDLPAVSEIMGPGSGWEHVFAVMQALAGRFGGDGVRLVAYFD